jgi:hypothetical protein
MKFSTIPDCNRCDAPGRCKGENVPCPRFCSPPDKWQMAELLLEHPNSLNLALTSLPFEANLNFYLKRA